MSEKNMAYIAIMSDIRETDKTKEEVKGLPFVREIYSVYGVYDLMAKIEGNDRSEINENVTKLRRVPGVRATLSFFTLGKEYGFKRE
jgi:DNA-binding Lrp family transcriptional regulator